MDNKLSEAACFRQNVPYPVSQQHQAVSMWSWKAHPHRPGEAKVTDSSEDGAEGKKNENKEEWEFRESPKSNKQPI